MYDLKDEMDWWSNYEETHENFGTSLPTSGDRDGGGMYFHLQETHSRGFQNPHKEGPLQIQSVCAKKWESPEVSGKV